MLFIAILIFIPAKQLINPIKKGNFFPQDLEHDWKCWAESVQNNQQGPTLNTDFHKKNMQQQNLKMSLTGDDLIQTNV